jgi:hypothetical protein
MRNYLSAGFSVVLMTSCATLAMVGFTAAASKTAKGLPELSCDETISKNFKPNANTKVLLVKQWRKGDKLPNPTIQAYFDPPSDTALADACMVKLLVGPGNPGPAGAPSTSPGIGVEIWLPAKGAWNGRLHAIGGGGWAGNEAADVSKVAMVAASNDVASPPALVASGAVISSTDTGHAMTTSPGGAFAMKPDGTVNTALWTDFASRAIHEQVVLARSLATAYYGTAPKFSYWDGASTGGRQALKQAQRYPQDFDGIIAASPAINWTRFTTSRLYPYLVIERDLGGRYMTAKQLDLVSNAAIAACDMVGGKHLGFILDETACRYDPTKDRTVLCAAQGGIGAPDACVNFEQARAINKIWYGMTTDGSVPDPAADNGFGPLTGKHKWYGLSRGTSLADQTASSRAILWPDMVALELGDPKLAGSDFHNAVANGADGWRALSYAQLAKAFDRGVTLQPQFGFINTDDPDLKAFAARGGKLIQTHGANDNLIVAAGSFNYYENVLARVGGAASVQKFYRFFLLPGVAHAPNNGTANPAANPPVLKSAGGELFKLLTDWVEKGIAPDRPVLRSGKAGPNAMSLPLCAYPAKVTFVSGDIYSAQSYTCK